MPFSEYDFGAQTLPVPNPYPNPYPNRVDLRSARPCQRNYCAFVVSGSLGLREARLSPSQRGQGRIEYAVILLAVLVAVVIVVAVIGGHANGAFSNAGVTPTPG